MNPKSLSHFLSLVLLCLSSWLQASNSTTDSLLLELEGASSDRERIDIGLELLRSVKESDRSNEYEYSQQILEVEKRTPYPEARMLTYSSMGDLYFYLGKMDSARKYAALSMEGLDLFEDQVRKSRALQTSARVFLRLGDIEAGRRYSLKGWQLAWSMTSPRHASAFANLLGVAALMKGEMDSAQDWFEVALNGYRETQNPAAMATALGNLGIIYEAQGLKEDALKVFLEVDSLYRLNGNQLGLATINFNIGFIYEGLKDHDRAFEYYQKVLELTEETGQLREKGRAISGLSSLYLEKDSMNLSLQYAEEGLRIQEELRNPREIANANLYLSHTLLKRKQYPRAIETALVTKSWAEESGDIDFLGQSAEVLAKAYLETGRYQQSAENFLQFVEVRDSVLDAESIREASDLAAKIEYEKELTRKELEQKMKDDQEAVELAQERLINNILLLALAGVFVFLVVLTWSIARVRNQNRELKRKGDRILFLNENLERLVKERTQTLEKRNAQLADYVFTNSHRVRGPIARILGLMELYHEGGFPTEEDKEQVFGFVHTAAKEADAVIFEINERLETEE